MQYPHLKDASILIVEDEVLIAMDISMAFETTGAHLTITNTLRHATVLVEHDGLTAAILDHALSDGNCNGICKRLTDRDVPFIVYSGYARTEGPCKDAPHLMKPATYEQLLEAVEAVIRDHKISN